MNLVDELLYFYYVYDKFQKDYLDEEEARKYHEIAVKKGRINYVSDGNILLGYCESWRINFEQFGRIICGLPFNIKNEDIETGEIAYVANTTIHPEHRRSYVIRSLTRQFFKSNIDCKFFCGIARRKKHQPVKVFSAQQAYKKWAKD